MQAQWIVLTVIVVVLVSKLISVLGKEEQKGEKVRLVSKETGQILEMRLIKKTAQKEEVKKTSEFDENDFLMGAKMAFNTVVDAFSNGNKETLKPLLSRQVFECFSSEIDRRNEENQKMEFSLVRVNSSKIVEKKKSPVRVTVDFVSEQVNVLRAQDGTVLEGDPIYIGKVHDVWTFEKGKSKNWIVTETSSEAVNA